MIVWFGETVFDCDAIAFDKDGTLIDHVSFWMGLYETRIYLFNERLNSDVVSVWKATNGLDDGGRQIDPDSPFAVGTFEEEKVILAGAIYAIERTPWDQAIELAGELLTEADNKMPKSAYTNPLPGVPNTLIELAECGLLLCVLTSDIRKRATDMIRELDFEDAIKCVITPEDVEHGKPAPDMIIHAAKKLNVAVSKIAMVGDSVLDIKMARAAGAFPVLVSKNCGQSSEVEGLSESTIRSITEIRVK